MEYIVRIASNGGGGGERERIYSYHESWRRRSILLESGMLAPARARDIPNGQKRFLGKRIDGQISSVVLFEPRKYLEILERYGKTVGLTVPRPSKNCPTQRWCSVKRLRFDWILRRSNWLGKKQRETANCRRNGKESSGKKSRREMKIVLFRFFLFLSRWRKN